MISITIIIITLVVLLCDIGHFIKTCLTVVIGRAFQRKYKITETTVQYGFCTTRDVDMLCTHMNNSRYLRAADFARAHFLDRTGIFDIVAPNKILLGASAIRYRKPIDIFSLYKIETKVLCWESETIFLEHKFITLKDEFVRAIVLSRAHLVGVAGEDLSSMMGIPSLIAMRKAGTYPHEVVLFQQCLETASAKLRKKC